jgi:hypothetical protein
MKFQADKSDAQTITGYGPGWIAVDKQNHETSLLVGARGLLTEWNCARFEDLTAEHFENLPSWMRKSSSLAAAARTAFHRGLAQAADRQTHWPGEHGHRLGLPHL